jgi:integrase
LGKVKIQHLDVERVESAASEWEKATSAKTANKMLTTLTAVMDLALRYKLTRENPAERAERLKVETDEEDGEVVTPDKIYNEAELKKLLKASEKLPLAEGLLVRVPALLGLRIGEVLGLTWGAIDLKEGRLSVRFALADGDKGSGALLQPPKSKSSRRTLVMSDGLRRDFAALKLAAELKGDDDLIFVTPEEKKPFHRKAATKILDRAIIGAGIERRTFHALRHTFASVLLMRGKPPVEVAAKLGHKDPNVTLRVYAHFIRRENEAADLADLEGVG